jgi:hypothetical protein
MWQLCDDLELAATAQRNLRSADTGSVAGQPVFTCINQSSRPTVLPELCTVVRMAAQSTSPPT